MDATYTLKHQWARHIQLGNVTVTLYKRTQPNGRKGFMLAYQHEGKRRSAPRARARATRKFRRHSLKSRFRRPWSCKGNDLRKASRIETAGNMRHGHLLWRSCKLINPLRNKKSNFSRLQKSTIQRMSNRNSNIGEDITYTEKNCIGILSRNPESGEMHKAYSCLERS
jgi:hypothetical protein